MITETVAIVRVGVSLLLGGIIGIERYLHKHPAGVRTFMLTSLGSTLATLASVWICENNTNLLNGDPGRIAAQVLTGIGFIGAGLIIKNNNDISGLTTATGIFVTAAIGIAVGVGMYLTAAVATLAVTGILFSSFLFHDSRKDKKQE
ncbi:MAG: MgtC/SapB family protein [Bacteroidaceae bacterium]|nr:MgtC/SapB family protein [Bacteroidaceae bacterium]